MTPRRNSHPRHLFLRPRHSGRVRVAPVLPGLPVHEEQGPPSACRPGLDAAAGRHRPAADLQRDVRRGPADRRGVRARLPARAARDPGAGRLDRRDAHRGRAGGAAAMRRTASTSRYIHRTDRTGYKAGALEAGMQVAKGEFIAIFDADFIPTADFLRRTVPFFGDGRIAMVQARWGHINQDYSLLTKIQSILLDGALRARARRPQPRRPVLQLQRHGRHLAAHGDRRRRRLAARHADRGSRPQLPRAAARLEVRLPAGPGRAGRSAGRDELLQVAAAPLGEGLDPDVPQAAAADPARRTCRCTSRRRRSST